MGDQASIRHQIESLMWHSRFEGLHNRHPTVALTHLYLPIGRRHPKIRKSRVGMMAEHPVEEVTILLTLSSAIQELHVAVVWMTVKTHLRLEFVDHVRNWPRSFMHVKVSVFYALGKRQYP